MNSCSTKNKGKSIFVIKLQETVSRKLNELYPIINNVEGIFSLLKRKILTKIISKNYITKKREVAFKIVIYNISQ